MIKDSKINFANNFMKISLHQHHNEMISMLTGYCISELKVPIVGPFAIQIKKKLDQFKELIIDKILTRKNSLYIVVDSLFKTQKRFGDNLYNAGNVIEYFKESIAYNITEVAMQQSYIQDMWRREHQQQNKLMEEEEMIKKMLEEERLAHKSQIQQMEKAGMQCQICLVEIDPTDIGVLECGHVFHRQCLHEHIKAAVNTNELNIKCPMEECKVPLGVNDVVDYIEGDLLEKYNKFSFNKFVEENSGIVSWCPTAGCSAVFQFDQALDNYKCPACGKHYCLKCKCDYHTGMTCAEYRINNSFSEEDKKFVQFVKGSKFKQCPKCKYWVQRNDGCSTMTCKCGQQFCYDCGGTGCPHGSCSGSGNASGPGLLGAVFGGRKKK